MMLSEWLDFQVTGIPATMALASVALIGYLVGKQSRDAAEPAESSASLERALADARQLEQLTDEMLSATREAIDHCRRLRLHTPAGVSSANANPIGSAELVAKP